VRASARNAPNQERLFLQQRLSQCSTRVDCNKQAGRLRKHKIGRIPPVGNRPPYDIETLRSPNGEFQHAKIERDYNGMG